MSQALSALAGFIVGIMLAITAGSELQKDEIKAGYFQTDGKAYRIIPITEPHDGAPPLAP